MALLAAYNFTGTGTSVADDSGNGHTGTLVLDCVRLTGHTGSGIGHSSGPTAGSGCQIARTGLEPTTAITIMAWVRKDAAIGAGFRSIIGKGRSGSDDSYQLWGSYSVEGRPRFDLTTSAGLASVDSGAATLEDGLWHHVAGTWDGTTAKIYVDGTLANSASIGGTISYDTSYDVWIGNSGYWTSEQWVGEIDDVRIYSHALTSTEINTDKNTPVTAGSTGATVTAVVAGAGSTRAPSPLVAAGAAVVAAASLMGAVRAPAPTVTTTSSTTVAATVTGAGSIRGAAPTVTAGAGVTSDVARLAAVRAVAPTVTAGVAANTNATVGSAGGAVSVAPTVTGESLASGGGSATLGSVRGVAPTVAGGAGGGATVNATPTTIGSITGASPALAVGSVVRGGVATLGTVRGNTAAAGATVTIVAAVATLGPVCSPTSVPTAAATLPATPARFSAVRVVAPTVVGGSANDGTPVANPRAHLTVARSRAILTTHSSRGTVT